MQGNQNQKFHEITKNLGRIRQNTRRQMKNKEGKILRYRRGNRDNKEIEKAYFEEMQKTQWSKKGNEEEQEEEKGGNKTRRRRRKN